MSQRALKPVWSRFHCTNFGECVAKIFKPNALKDLNDCLI